MICGSGLDPERSRRVWTLSEVEGVPAGHIVHLILDAVEQIPITNFRVNDRGSSSEQYPPRMMLALLIYCYATGRFGSRTNPPQMAPAICLGTWRAKPARFLPWTGW
jgi:hypothetical protein